MNDLAAATGMAKPGLYAAFGDKETLFARALEQYATKNGEQLYAELKDTELPIRSSIKRFLTLIAKFLTDESTPPGCFLVRSIVDNVDSESPLMSLARKFENWRREALSERFEIARAKGEIPLDADPEKLAEFFAAQVSALAVISIAGADLKTLERIIDTAITAVPETPHIPPDSEKTTR